jgi:hypothetical protein
VSSEKSTNAPVKIRNRSSGKIDVASNQIPGKRAASDQDSNQDSVSSNALSLTEIKEKN